ncbi:MAG: hypothetical protein AUG80_08430 [Candidatus Rokubacteria bacterium 13_1_20CM_4_68_9]|nr:MAG: hypothetical protein AUG80_08430 [Candidatus Rokubacteria bacterium 13_1_20CM_4_68_9]
MTDVTKAQELFVQLAGKTIEAMALWAEANQRVLRELVELGSTTAKESVRLYGDLQRAGLESLREGQSWTMRWQGGWKDASDPVAWYQKLMADGVNGTQQAFRLAEESAQAVTRAAERVQATTEQAGKGILREPVAARATWRLRLSVDPGPARRRHAWPVRPRASRRCGVSAPSRNVSTTLGRRVPFLADWRRCPPGSISSNAG